MDISPKNDPNDLAAKIETNKAKHSIINSVPNWLIEALAWIGRIEMAKASLSFSCQIFKQLCWPKLHSNVKPFVVPRLQIIWTHKLDEFGNFRATIRRCDICRMIPIANIPPPKYIVGFSGISIMFLNGQIMQFIECILPILSEIHLSFVSKIPFYLISNERTAQINQLFKMLATKAFALSKPGFFNFLEEWPNFDLDNVQSIVVKLEERNMDSMVEWLTKSRADREPKMIKLKSFRWTGKEETIFLENIKKQFSESTQSAHFIIHIANENDSICPNFLMENELTGEIMALYVYGNENLERRQFLIRHTKGEEYLRANWEKQIQLTMREMHYVKVEILKIGKF